MKHEKNNAKKQMLLYFTFAVFMMILNYGIQKINQIISPILCSSFTGIEWLQLLYCTKEPNMSEFIGSAIAVSLTYIIKFFLDKFFVFRAMSKKLKQTSREFTKYLFFAVLTTLENLGIQFILTNLFHTPIELSVFIALPIGYLTKFFLDRTYVFQNEILSENL